MATDETASFTTAPSVRASSYDASQLDWPRNLGREVEHQGIVDFVARLMTANASPEMLIIHGESGVGKSVAITVAAEETLTSHGADVIWATGKYGQLDESRPFSAIVDATINMLEHLKPNTVEKIRQSFNQVEARQLSAVISVLSDLFLDDPYRLEQAPIDPAAFGDQHGFITFLRLFRRLLRLVCAECKCLVLYLDDVQWSDEVSRELLEGILSDTKLRNFGILCSQRTGEGEPDFKLASNMPSMLIEVKPLNGEKTNALVAQALAMEPEKTTDLGELVYKRTGGNPLYLVQFVEYLYARNSITKAEDQDCYEWDVAAIATQTKAATNVVDLLVKKLKSVPFEIRMALVVASHLGFKFKAGTLTKVLEDIVLVNLFTSRHPLGLSQYMNTLYSGLEQATRIGLIEHLSKEEFRFTHDRVQQAARSLLPAGDAGVKILARLGELLLRSLKSGSEAWVLFAATKLLTKNSTESVSNVEVAELCAEAATVARKQAAYRNSAKYAESGTKQFGKGGWKTNYRLLLDLHCIAAEMYYASGNMEKAKSAIEKVEKHARSIVDKFRPRRVLLDIFSSESEMASCVKQGRLYLKDVGVSFPRRPTQLNIVSNLLKSKRLLRGRDAKELLGLPAMTDSKITEAVHILSVMAEAAFQSGDDDACACACMIMLHLVLRHGISDKGVFAFVSYAVCLTHLGFIPEAVSFFEVAKELCLAREGAFVHASVALHLMGCYLSHEVIECPKELQRSHDSAMALGNIYKASTSIRCAVPFEFYVGKSLQEVERRLLYCQEFFKDYKQESSYTAISPTMQLVECLQGRTEDPFALSGSFVDDCSVLGPLTKSSKLNTDQSLLVLEVYYCRIVLFLVHNKNDMIIEDRHKHGSILKEEMGSYYRKILNYFHLAMAYLGSANKSRSNLRHGRRYQREIEKHAVTGSPMLKTLLVMLSAEEAAIRKDSGMARKLYDQAIDEFSQQSLFLYKAIALERAGKYCFSAGIAHGTNYMQGAYAEYDRYGAYAKTSLLRFDHTSIDFAGEVPQSIGV